MLLVTCSYLPLPTPPLKDRGCFCLTDLAPRVFLKRRPKNEDSRPKTPWTKTKTPWTKTKNSWTKTKTPCTKTKTPLTTTKTQWTKTTDANR